LKFLQITSEVILCSFHAWWLHVLC